METNWENEKPRLYIIQEVKSNESVQVQDCNIISTTNEDSRPTANYFSQTDSERTTTRKRSLSRFGTTQVCPNAGNDAATETGSNEAQRSST